MLSVTVESKIVVEKTLSCFSQDLCTNLARQLDH